jgi:hypothetical protein
MCYQAKVLQEKLAENEARDAAAAARIEADRAIPKWKLDAVNAKRKAAEKKRLAALSKEQKQELADETLSHRKAETIRLKTIARQADLEQEEMMLVMGSSLKRKKDKRKEARSASKSAGRGEATKAQEAQSSAFAKEDAQFAADMRAIEEAKAAKASREASKATTADKAARAPGSQPQTTTPVEQHAKAPVAEKKNALIGTAPLSSAPAAAAEEAARGAARGSAAWVAALPEKRRAFRRSMAERMMAAAKADAAWPRDRLAAKENSFVLQMRQATHSFRDKLAENALRDAAAAARMEADRAIPKWKLDAVNAKRKAAEKKRLAALSKEQKQELADEKASKLKAETIRLKTLVRQVQEKKNTITCETRRSKAKHSEPVSGFRWPAVSFCPTTSHRVWMEQATVCLCIQWPLNMLVSNNSGPATHTRCRRWRQSARRCC